MFRGHQDYGSRSQQQVYRIEVINNPVRMIEVVSQGRERKSDTKSQRGSRHGEVVGLPYCQSQFAAAT